MGTVRDKIKTSLGKGTKDGYWRDLIGIRTPPAATGIRFGYARCSTVKQELDYQIEEFRKRGIPKERVYQDLGWSGKNLARPKLDELRAKLREGDSIEFLSMNRAGRNQRDTCLFFDEMEEKGVNVVIYDMEILSTGSNALEIGLRKTLWYLFGYLAEQELKMISKKSHLGMRHLMAHEGMKPGKKPLPPETVQIIRNMFDVHHKPIAVIAREVNRSRTAVAHYIKDRTYAPTPPIKAARNRAPGAKPSSEARIRSSRENGAKYTGKQLKVNIYDSPTNSDQNEYAF